MLAAAAERHRIEWRWVKGHADNELNIRADKLAREGMAPFLARPSASNAFDGVAGVRRR